MKGFKLIKEEMGLTKTQVHEKINQNNQNKLVSIQPSASQSVFNSNLSKAIFFLGKGWGIPQHQVESFLFYWSFGVNLLWKYVPNLFKQFIKKDESWRCHNCPWYSRSWCPSWVCSFGREQNHNQSSIYSFVDFWCDFLEDRAECPPFIELWLNTFSSFCKQSPLTWVILWSHTWYPEALL